MSFIEGMKLFFSSVWSFLAPLVSQFATQAGQLLAAAALEAVSATAASMVAADGAAKRDAAFKAITDKLKTQGIEMSASLINASIEVAVQKLKAK